MEITPEYVAGLLIRPDADNPQQTFVFVRDNDNSTPIRVDLRTIARKKPEVKRVLVQGLEERIRERAPDISFICGLSPDGRNYTPAVATQLGITPIHYSHSEERLIIPDGTTLDTKRAKTCVIIDDKLREGLSSMYALMLLRVYYKTKTALVLSLIDYGYPQAVQVIQRAAKSTNQTTETDSLTTLEAIINHPLLLEREGKSTIRDLQRWHQGQIAGSSPTLIHLLP